MPSGSPPRTTSWFRFRARRRHYSGHAGNSVFRSSPITISGISLRPPVLNLALTSRRSAVGSATRTAGLWRMKVYGHLREEHSFSMAKRVAFETQSAENIAPMAVADQAQPVKTQET